MRSLRETLRFRQALEKQAWATFWRSPSLSRPNRRWGSRRIDHVLAGAPGEAWERISCGDGVKSPRATTGPRPS